jgi:hypothetical protein
MDHENIEKNQNLLTNYVYRTHAELFMSCGMQKVGEKTVPRL